MGLEAEAPNAGKHIASWKTQLGGIDHIHLVYGYLGARLSNGFRVAFQIGSASAAFFEIGLSVLRSPYGA